MHPHLQFNQRDLGHGASGTVLHPVVLVALVLTSVLILVLPRKYVVVPLLLITFLVPRGQVIVLAGLHLYVRLIVLLVGFVRLARARFQVAGGLNSIDKLFILWAGYRVGAAILTNWPDGLAEQVNFGITAYCGYFLLRHLIQNEEDIVRTAKTFALITVILGSCMLYEHIHDVNIFGYLGGVRLIPEMRDGAIRAQASLGHSILAGCCGATLVPLFFWLWKSGNSRPVAVIGILGSTLMVFASCSSTPLLACAAGVLGLSLWPIRRSMRTVRWGIVGALVILAAIMNAPVWWAVAYANVVGGSGGYDRAYLIDTFMRHLLDWWLIGTNQNGNWGYDMWDLSNQFVAEGEIGGLVAVTCFIAIICQSYSRLGKMRRRVRVKDQWLLWSLGAAMLAHIYAFFGVAYWDQTQIWWFASLAMISTATIGFQGSSAKACRSNTAHNSWVS
jgi:hypothetical protein